MTPVVKLLQGDCKIVMAQVDENSIDAIVADPPYDLTAVSRNGSPSTFRDNPYGRARIGNKGAGGGFMGKAWDASGIAFDPEMWAEALRILKPGGYLLSFGGTRTYHRMTVAIEDAGFEIRDCLMWLYGSGFPKSQDVAKAIDKHHGKSGSWRQEDHPGRPGKRTSPGDILGQTDHRNDDNPDGLRHIYAPESLEAQRWQGWGSALKPAFEPIVLARKPMIGTMAKNITEHGTGALNIAAARIDTNGQPKTSGGTSSNMGYMGVKVPVHSPADDTLGRWPANLILDEEAAAMLDEQTGTMHGHGSTRHSGSNKGMFPWGTADRVQVGGESGGASRFFYVAKASRSERDAGLDDMSERVRSIGDERPSGGMHEWYGDGNGSGRSAVGANHHPTVKPIALMRWLVRLVTPPGGVILDPFLGSGSTGCAAVLEGFDFIGIELDEDEGYIQIAERRIAHWQREAKVQAILRGDYDDVESEGVLR